MVRLTLLDKKSELPLVESNQPKEPQKRKTLPNEGSFSA